MRGLLSAGAAAAAAFPQGQALGAAVASAQLRLLGILLTCVSSANQVLHPGVVVHSAATDNSQATLGFNGHRCPHQARTIHTCRPCRPCGCCQYLAISQRWLEISSKRDTTRALAGVQVAILSSITSAAKKEREGRIPQIHLCRSVQRGPHWHARHCPQIQRQGPRRITCRTSQIPVQTPLPASRSMVTQRRHASWLYLTTRRLDAA